EVEDTGGTLRTVISADPDDETTIRGFNKVQLDFDGGEIALTAQKNSFVRLYHNNVRAVDTAAPASGGLLIDNTLTGAGQERALTVTDMGVLKIKDADKPITNSNTLEDDDDLAGWSLEADTRYYIEGLILYTQNVGNIRFKFVLDNAEQESGYTLTGADTSGTTHNRRSDITDLVAITTFIDGQEAGVHFSGYVKSHATLASTLDFQWAQDNSNANATIVREGSWIKVTKTQ
ncbi:MAG: hypothetical protein MJA83_20395, partial [Gammaproteobacteria bacterium]|nr:hypothetical protein [Gammaproteobacteria bacterium]